MAWFNETLNAAGAAIGLDTACANDELYVAFTTGVTPDLSDGGHTFMADLIAAGGSIETETQLTGCSYSNRTVTGPTSATIPDPGGATTATWAVLYHKTGNNSTARIYSADDITDLIFDGNDDDLTLSSPLLRLGS